MTESPNGLAEIQFAGLRLHFSDNCQVSIHLEHLIPCDTNTP